MSYSENEASLLSENNELRDALETIKKTKKLAKFFGNSDSEALEMVIGIATAALRKKKKPKLKF